MDNDSKSSKTTQKKSKFELFLSTYSEIVFLYTSLPTFILNFLGLVTGILLFVHKSEYYSCKSSDDPLFALLLGQLIFYYGFFIIYSNLLFQLIPALNTLTVTFALFLTYFILCSIFNLWGISALSATECQDSVYAGMAGFNISFNFIFDLALLLSFIALAIKNRKIPEIKPTPLVLSEERFVEQPSAIEDPKVAEGNWKEENLDGF